MEPGSLTVRETIHRTDLETGVRVRQLTSTPAIHENIYGEVPYMDGASRYCLLTRRREAHGLQEVWRYDFERDWLTPVCEDVPSIAGMAVSPDQRYFTCQRRIDAETFELVITEIATLEQRALRFRGWPEIRALGSIGPDNRTYISGTAVTSHRFGIVRYDLEAGTRQVIHEWDDIINPHPQIEPATGRDILVQHNRGCLLDDQGRCLRLVGPEGATLYLIDIDGGNRRELPVGKPYTLPCQGHQSWLGRTGDILLTVGGAPVEELEEGNLLRLRPGEPAATVVARGHAFWHPNASLDGRFFVSDTIGDGRLVIGSFRTGRTRVLCGSGASCSSPQYTHPHPYLSPDCRWVIYNSDATGVPHVHAARVPEGWLEELEDQTGSDGG